MASSPARAARFTPARLRAVGILRVSEVGGRGGETFRSPRDQRDIIERHCDLRKYKLVAVFEELDVSGYSLSLAKRPGLGPAVAMIERGEADVLIVPYLDRLARNVSVFRKTIKRIEAAGGLVEAVDFGDVSGGTAVQKFSVETLVRMAELFAEMTAEKTQRAKEDAIAAGIPTFDHIPFGYRKDPETRRLRIEPDEAVIVRQAFSLREGGATLEEIRDFLRANGGKQGIRGVQHLLQQRMYLGELRFGNLINLHSHEAIVDPGLFRVVQGMRVARGSRATPTNHLLARLGIVRCASCERALVVGGQVKYGKDRERRQYKDYRCSNMGDCDSRVVISAQFLDRLVVSYVRQADAEGHASVDEQLEQAEAEYRQSEDALSNVVSMLEGLGDLQAARDRIASLKAQREAAFEHWQSLRSLRGTAGVRASDWEMLDFAEQRALIRATIKRIVVSRGTPGVRAESRVRIEPFAQ